MNFAPEEPEYLPTKRNWLYLAPRLGVAVALVASIAQPRLPINTKVACPHMSSTSTLYTSENRDILSDSSPGKIFATNWIYEWNDTPAQAICSATMEYTAIDPSRKEIRLLNLHCGKPGDRIACSISTLSLDDLDVDYEALSYVWGLSNGNCVAHIEGVLVPITDNLWQALNGLRHMDRDRKLWVAALCINQRDNNERSEQVALMNLVYSQATSVEIWLGEPYEGVEIAIKTINEIATGVTAEGLTVSYAHLEGAFPSNFDSTKQHEYLLDDNARESIALVLAIVNFARRPWFHRIWTVQEFFLAEKSTLHCGTHTLDGTLFLQFVFHINFFRRLGCSVSLPLRMKLNMRFAFRSMNAIIDLKMKSLSFLECSAQCRSRKATDTRDMIYGLLGLRVEDAPKLDRLDYTVPTAKIYEDLVVSLLSHTKSLNFLSHITAGHRLNLDLPSFVPDWSSPPHISHPEQLTSWLNRCSTLNIYDAAFGKDVEYEARPGILKIRGVIVDTVKSVAVHTIESGDPYEKVKPSESTSSGFNVFLDELETIAALPPLPDDPGLANRQSFWLTMVAGVLPTWKNIPQQLADLQEKADPASFYYRILRIATQECQEFERLLRNSPTDSVDDHIPRHLTHLKIGLANAHFGRRFMKTQQGRIGLIPPYAEKGDVVAVLTGGHVPIILRPHDGFYTVLGDAYVHGIMDGEAMIGKQNLEYIELH